MPKQLSNEKRGLKKDPPPLVSNEVLTVWDYELDQLIDRYAISQPKNWPYWQTFLATEKSFRYECALGAFTAIKEIRRGSQNKPRPAKVIWYAHRRIKTKLRRKYLGQSESLTTEKLWQAAFDLAQLPQNEIS